MIWENDSVSYKSKNIGPTQTDTSNMGESGNRLLTEKSNNNIKAFNEPKAIKLDFAYELFKDGIKFIDARPVEEFEVAHIKGAVNIPFYESEKYENALSKIPMDETIVTYCNGHDCDLSIMLGDELFKKGYKRVYVFYGGWNEWLSKKYPTESLSK